MADFRALPGDLNVSLTVGDEFIMFVDLDIDTTSFTWTSIVYQVNTSVTFTDPAGVNTQGPTAATFTVTPTNAASGQLHLSLTETQTGAFVPSTRYRWYLRGVSPTGFTRTYLAGTFTAVAP